MELMKEFKNGRRNSFEDNDRSLDCFQYMDGNLQPVTNGKILVYRWNPQSQSNERVWIKTDAIDLAN